MTTVSNLYAAKLYSEHPLGIWPLDDDTSYISLINDQQRKFESASGYAGWTITNGTANDPDPQNPLSLQLPNEDSPFTSDIYAGINGITPTVNGTIIKAISPNLFLFSDCNQDLETFCISMYVYQASNYVSEYEIGYEYYDNDALTWIEVTTTFPALKKSGWTHIYDTFRIQEFDADYCRIIFKAVVNVGGFIGNYDFIINGITVGQWSENFISQSLGATLTTTPVSASSLSACLADQYGILSDNAYYLVENGKLLAKNQGIPMIYGSENVTRLYPSASALPSLIFPNKKMLTEEGRYNNYTLEAWIKLRPTVKQAKKIFGPLDTNDGVYVQEGFITLIIDEKFMSYNISEWYRPMLVHLVIKNSDAIMFINGEQVASVEINKSTMKLSKSDWMAFYTYDDFDLFEIDCISIFPYDIPLQVARKRFVWGQGVESAEIVNNSFDGEEAVIQFANAKYNVNYIYPDKERWDAGSYNNMVATTNSISVPQYVLPEINIGGRDISEWYRDNRTINEVIYRDSGHPLFFTLRPNVEDYSQLQGGYASTTSFDAVINGGFSNSTFTSTIDLGDSTPPFPATNWTEQAYMVFPTMSFLTSPISAFYGIFELEKEVYQTRPLIHIVNILTGKRFEININGYDVTYNFDGEELLGTGFTVQDEHFVVGLHVPTFIRRFNFELASFFGNPDVLQFFIAGDGVTSFEGKIYRIGFADQSNFDTISEHFDLETGIVNYEEDALFQGHYASYTLSPFIRYNTYFLDISLEAKWEEYFPLTSFASYITKRDGDRAYDLDYLQINYGYPSLIQIVSSSVDNVDWTYQELFDAYNDPIQKSYEILDNPLLSGYETYANQALNIVTQYEIETTGSSMDAYITFQLLAEGANEPLSSFTYDKPLTDSYTVYGELENTDINPYGAYKTKFQIINGTIIYPPKKIDFKDVAMVIHFVVQQDGIISNPLKIKNLEITSRCLNENELTPIGTRSGMPIYPYVKTGIYYSGKSKNPVMIGKDNLPYLYLTEKTGVKVLKYDAETEYGIIVPINFSESRNYLLGACQMFLKYDITRPTGTIEPIFDLIHPNGVIEFVLQTDETAKRFYISARDKVSKQKYENIKLYLNGVPTSTPYINNKEWNSLGFLFPEALDFSQYSGSINLLYGCSFNNVSFFKSSGLNDFSLIIPRNWQNILYNDEEEDPSNVVDWEYWYDQNGNLSIPNKWKDVYTLREIAGFSTTPKEIYKTYFGTNILVMDDDTGVSVVDDDFSMFADQNWLNFVQKPA